MSLQGRLGSNDVMKKPFEPESLNDLIDERLSESEVRVLSEHLRNSPTDAALLRELIAVRQRVQKLPELRPARDLTPLVMDKVAREFPDWLDAPTESDFEEVPVRFRSPRLSERTLRGVVAVLSFAVVVLLAFVIYPPLLGRRSVPAERMEVAKTESAAPSAAATAAPSSESSIEQAPQNLVASDPSAIPAAIVHSEPAPAGQHSELSILPGDSDRDPRAMGSVPGVADAVLNANDQSLAGNAAGGGSNAADLLPSPNDAGKAAVSQIAQGGIEGLETEPSPASPDFVLGGAEYVIIVRLPTIESPQDWIEKVLRQAKLEIESPHDDAFARSLAARLAADAGGLESRESKLEPEPIEPPKTNYYVEADLQQLKLIIERMPGANLEYFPIHSGAGRRDGVEAVPVPARIARRIEPLLPAPDPTSRDDEWTRADEVLHSLGIDQFPDRVHRVLFLFQLGDAPAATSGD